jgi:hypothetical protein
MPPHKKKPKEIKVIDGATSREYQAPELFKKKFQNSLECRKFRLAWQIPVNGYDDHRAYGTFYEHLHAQDRAYAKSEKFVSNRAILLEARKKWAEGKIRDGELEWNTREFERRIPSVKYDEDLDTIVRKSKKPPYWRNFIEECILFHDVDPTFISRPRLEPKLQWSNDRQDYEIIIGNIFADTTAEDFRSIGFAHQLKKLQTKLAVHAPTPRRKKNFEPGLKLMDLEDDKLTDREKADLIEGISPNDPTFMKTPKQDEKRKSKIKSMRRRIKSY